MKDDPWRQLDPLTDAERDAVHARIRKDWRYIASGLAVFFALVAGCTIAWFALAPVLQAYVVIRIGVYALMVVAIIAVFFRINRVLYDQALKRQVHLFNQASRPN